MGIRVTFLCSVVFATAAFASDGVLEINQTCAIKTGCFSGDAAGFPVTITSRGTSHRLSSPLVVPDENTDAIIVTTGDVGIDLNNFAILGPVSCDSGVCSPTSGTGSGVEIVGGNYRGVSVSNGSISGMGNWGVNLSAEAVVRNLRVRSNGHGGILTENGSTLLDNVSFENGYFGVVANAGSTVSGNSAFGNASDGIFVGDGSTVTGNTSFDNAGDGIFAGDGSTVSGNTAYGNRGDGIETTEGSTVQQNTVRANTRFGLNLGRQTTYRANTITGNTVGTVGMVFSGSAAVNLGDNHCAGPGTVSAVCP